MGKFPLPPNTMLNVLVSKWPKQDYAVLRISFNIVLGGEGGMFMKGAFFGRLVSSILHRVVPIILPW